MRVINTRGEVMAKGEKKVRIRITGGVIFEGRDLLPGETHVLPDWFAQSVIQSNRGVDPDAHEDEGEDEGEGEGEGAPAGDPAKQPPQRPQPRARG